MGINGVRNLSLYDSDLRERISRSGTNKGEHLCVDVPHLVVDVRVFTKDII